MDVSEFAKQHIPLCSIFFVSCMVVLSSVWLFLSRIFCCAQQNIRKSWDMMLPNAIETTFCNKGWALKQQASARKRMGWVIFLNFLVGSLSDPCCQSIFQITDEVWSQDLHGFIACLFLSESVVHLPSENETSDNGFYHCLLSKEIYLDMII